MPPPIFSFFISHWLITLPIPTQKFTNQTIIITGANTGLGLEAARTIARLGASKVVLACRDAPGKGQAAKQSILASLTSSHDDPPEIEAWPLDLASFPSIQAFATRAHKEPPRLDVVVANAGMMTTEWALAEGNERTVTVNVVGTMLLALLLMPKLRATSLAESRDVTLTFTGSFVHWMTAFPERRARFILEETARREAARMGDRYYLSKLLELLAVRELADRVTLAEESSGGGDGGRLGHVTVSMLNPGVVRTELERNASGWYLKLRRWLTAKLLSRSVEEGARTLVWAAYGGREAHGGYLDDCKVAKPSMVSDFVRSKEGQEVQKRLWKEIMEKLESVQPGIEGDISAVAGKSNGKGHKASED